MDGFVFQAGTKKVPSGKYEIRSQKYGILANIECCRKNDEVSEVTLPAGT
jgi:hypothetical protein